VNVLRIDRAAQLARDRDSLRTERIAAQPNFRDGRFVNPNGRGAPKVEAGVIGEFFFGGRKRKPPAPLPVVSPIDAWRDPSRAGLRATWLGHSTVLLEVDGARILTDPVWSDRASPSQIVGPRRFHPPPVAIDRLPPLDAILVSHDHFDHLDESAVRALARASAAPFFTALGVGARLEAFGVPAPRIIELAWWERGEVPGTAIEIAATPAQHFSGRGLLDRDRTLWASWVVRGPRHRIFFSGDTGLEPELPTIARTFGPFDLVMLEVGAYHPAWGDIHLGPEQALEAHAALGGGRFLPVHWSTFDLALHGWDEPILPLERAARERGLPLVAPRIGQPIDLADRPLPIDPWWRSVR
jgi:L-ascorbate metabolism protein UlaG (beta-lactamase superfamily)